MASLTDWFGLKTKLKKVEVSKEEKEFIPTYSQQDFNDNDIFKAYIPWYLYKPPYGFPREVNPLQLRQLGKNPYVFAVIKTLSDRVASTKRVIRLKKEYAEKDFVEDEITKLSIERFFERPNGNVMESFETILRSWVRDIAELDSGIGVKVFNKNGEFSQLFARDGGTFLLNPDMFGYYGDRSEFVEPITQVLLTQGLSDIPKQLNSGNGYGLEKTQLENVSQRYQDKQYDQLYKETAAYFQYGWTAGARPVPFGTREIMYIRLTPRTESIYGRSPLEILYNTILTLVYGSQYNLDFYLNNNLPNGVLTVKGASQTEANSYRAALNNQIMAQDELGNWKKQNFKVPISNREFIWTPMQMSSQEMQVIEQQQWFSKILWACFGVTADEMGFTENSNKAISENQSMVNTRKAVRPLLSAIQFAVNTQLMPEFGHPEYEFAFIEEDIDEDQKKHDIWEQQIRMGVRSARQIATEELNISEEDFNEAKSEKEADMQSQTDIENSGNEGESLKGNVKKRLLEKGKENKDVEKKAEEYPESRPMEDAIVDRLSIMEREVVKDIENKFQKGPLTQIKGFVNVKGKVDDDFKKFQNFVMNANLDEKVNKALNEVLSKGMESVEVQFGINSVVKNNKIDFFKDYVFSNIKGMNDDLIIKLKAIISRAILSNTPKGELLVQIKTAFNTSMTRARVIARTETTRALNMGARQVAEGSGLKLKKVWDAKLDNRTSDICIDLDGKEKPMNENFSYKGESWNEPPAHPNCRSLIRYEQY